MRVSQFKFDGVLNDVAQEEVYEVRVMPCIDACTVEWKCPTLPLGP